MFTRSIMIKNSRVLVISDLHIPYHHKHTIPFLKALKDHINPDRIIYTGDEVDWHSISFHDKNPELFSPTHELLKSIEYLKEFYELFPEADVLESNHGSLVYRKGLFHGLPRSVFRSYGEILEAPKRWRWSPYIIIKLPNGRTCYFTHGISPNGIALSQQKGMSVIQGHFHNSFEIRYWGNETGIFWSMIVGCLIDNKSYAFAYNKTNLKIPLIGCGAIIDSAPFLYPMVLDSKGDWIGKISIERPQVGPQLILPLGITNP